MLGTSSPVLVSVPFASGAGAGYINPIPIPSQIVGGSDPGLASMTDGFPPRTFIEIASGGLPPRGADVNGILNLHSAAIQWAQLGCGYPYNAPFQTAIGGYPKGAIIPRSDLTGSWVSSTDNNVTNPETFGAGWLPYGGSTALLNITVGGSTITLTALQAATGVIRLNGTLTANINLVLPNWPGFQWTIISNYTRNNFRVTAKMATGLTVTLSPVGAALVYCNGTSLINNALQVGMASDAGQAVQLGQFTSSLGTNGWSKRPDGIIEQWGIYTPPDASTHSVTLNIAFPTAGLNGSATSRGVNVGASCSNVTPSAIELQSTTGGVSMFWRAIGY